MQWAPWLGRLSLRHITRQDPGSPVNIVPLKSPAVSGAGAGQVEVERLPGTPEPAQTSDPHSEHSEGLCDTLGHKVPPEPPKGTAAQKAGPPPCPPHAMCRRQELSHRDHPAYPTAVSHGSWPPVCDRAAAPVGHALCPAEPDR